MLDHFEELICFAAVCEAGSITGAAEALACSKAHVSRKLAELEARLGVRLMHRTTRRITFTRAGEGLREQALQQYHGLRRLGHQAQSIDDRLSGRFVMTAPLSLCTFLLAPEMPDLHAAFPDIRFDIRPSNESLDLLSEGVDLAVRSGSAVDEDLIAHSLGSAREIFLAPAGGMAWQEDAGADQSADLSLLRERPLYLNPYSLTDQRLRLSNGAEIIELEPDHASLVSDFALMLDLARREDGIALAPDYCLSSPGQGMVQCLPEWQGREWPVLMVYPFLSPLPAKLAVVAGYLRPRLAARLRRD